MINLTIDGVQIEAKEGQSILSAAREHGIHIPTLCFLEKINEIGSCRICVVEVEGMNKLVTACNTKVKEGMVVQTASRKVIDARKTILKLLLSNHNIDCFNCEKNGDCQLQNMISIQLLTLDPEACWNVMFRKKMHIRSCPMIRPNVFTASAAYRLAGLQPEEERSNCAEPVNIQSLTHRLVRTGKRHAVSPAVTVHRPARPVP